MRVSSHNIPDTDAAARPLVTVFCAVWHKQCNKLELLRSHWENLKRQTLPVEPCYIFDNGDTAPDWLDAPWHSFSEPLTIYQAWAAGVALARTRFVMNLNMDDRLASNAVELMLSGLVSENVALIGGEWVIRFDYGFQTEDFGATDTANTRFAPAWPPAPLSDGAALRLGSGTGERGTYGPATLWDLDKTQRWYPTNFGNGDPILSIGDAIFWMHLQQTGQRMARMSLVIGRYYSSPDAQAEFRPHNDHDLLSTHGVSKGSFAHQIAASQSPGSQPVLTLPPPRNGVERNAHALALKYSDIFRRDGRLSAQSRA